MAEVDPFQQNLKRMIEQYNLSSAQLYNFDETGLLYRKLPENTLASNYDDFEKEKKLCKERLSALLCSNANGSHRLKAVIVGKSQKPCALKTYLHPLPVHYYHNAAAWFTRDMVEEWFFKCAEPEIRRFQIDVLKILPDDVCALILMDKALAHPDCHSLSSRDGRIKCLAIPRNMSLAQPMEQGIILTTKRLYRKKFLDEVLVLPDETANEDFNNRRPSALANMKHYNLKAAIYNFSDAWRDVTQATLANAWKRLLNNSDVHWEMEGIEATDFLKALTTAGETEVTEASVLAWLEEDEADPGYPMLSEEQIVKEVLQAHGDGAPQAESDEEMVERKGFQLSTIRNHCDNILGYIDSSGDPAVQDYYEQFRNFRQIIIRRQQRSASQMTVNDFFTARSAIPPPASSAETVPEDAIDCS
ncbi:Tigger transposable element-derived protein 7 [Chionoecetes opilio]|uniref:Tigger transposable element-derived protein 7 n=1 Tax=Chionoecetes opilio TaxID=41210 RepID=A0A8J5CKV6_CHIOP|nr:Tigger transposable element-derived protein 7 [Chionoecetes opilio]